MSGIASLTTLVHPISEHVSHIYQFLLFENIYSKIPLIDRNLQLETLIQSFVWGSSDFSSARFGFVRP